MTFATSGWHTVGVTITAAAHTFWCEVDEDWVHDGAHLVDRIDRDSVAVESDSPCPHGCGLVLEDVVVRPGVVA